MTYAKIDNNHAIKYPYTDYDIRQDNPNVSFPSTMTDVIRADYHAFPVTIEEPTYDAKRQYIVQKDAFDWPVKDGKVIATYDIKNRTIEERKEILVADLKAKRWEHEISGVEVSINGEKVLVSTARGDDRTNLHITMTTIAAGLRQDGAVFNFADTKPRSVSNAEMMNAISAALMHVQSSFTKEGELTEEINQANTHAKLDLVLDKINKVW